ncbi:MAG: hypothetical protein R3F23_02815 [Verrucomicrobiia bacterium]
MKKLLIFCLLCQFLCCQGQPILRNLAILDLRRILPEKEYRVGEPIILQLIITNTADSTTLHDLGYNQKKILFFMCRR